jgi:hypothetical protein
MMELTFGNLTIGKYMTLILNNLCSGVSIQQICIDQGIGSLCVSLLKQLEDYEMHVNICKGLSALILA